MYHQVKQALAQQDYKTAARLLKSWQQQDRQDPWLLLAMAQYFEATDKLEKAAKLYGQTLQRGAQGKLLFQARQGVQRVRDELAHQREHALAEAKQDSTDAALLVLEPVAAEQRQRAAQGLAQVMQIDPYTARMLIPGKHWRLYRVGEGGELGYFQRQLSAAGTPAFWLPLAAVTTIPVFRGDYITAFTDELTLACRSATGQAGSLSFPWQAVERWVWGRVPLLGSVVDLDAHGRLTRRETTQDYAEIVDLHLPLRGCIVRLCDHTYRYRQGVTFPHPGNTEDPSPSPVRTATECWKAMVAYFQQQLTIPPEREFSGFGSGALDLIGLLPTIEPHLDLGRREENPWDSAFHLYSGLHYAKGTPKTSALI